MKDDQVQQQMKAFADWLQRDYKAFVVYSINAGLSVPKEQDYALRRLGVDYASYLRWRDQHGPIGPRNLVQVVVNAGDAEPLRIHGREDLLGNEDIMNIVAAWKSLPEEARARIVLIATEERQEPLKYAPL